EAHDLVRVLARVLVADLLDEVMTPRPDVDRARPGGVQPVLETVDVAVGIRLVGPSMADRKVVVDAVCSRLRMAHEDGREGADGDDDTRQERDVHDRDGKTAGNPRMADSPDQRI